MALIAFRIFLNALLVVASVIGLAAWAFIGHDMSKGISFGITCWIVGSCIVPNNEDTARFYAWSDARLAEHQATLANA